MSMPTTPSPQDSWLIALLSVSREIRKYVLRYETSGGMPEVGITAHLGYVLERLQAQLPAGLVVQCDSQLVGQRGEAFHGADLELWLRGGGLAFGLRLQAKRLFAPAAGRARTDGLYKNLKHDINKDPTRPQVGQLIDNTPLGLMPGYLFYNGLERSDVVAGPSGCCQGQMWPSVLTNDAIGLTWAPAQPFAAVGQTAKNKFSEVYQHSSPLLCLGVCPQLGPLPSRTALANAPLPVRAAAALSQVGLPLKITADPQQQVVWQKRLRDVDIEWSSPPEYLGLLAQTGSTGLQDDDRPAELIATFSEVDA